MNKKSRIDSKLTLNKSKDSKDDKDYDELELHVICTTHNQWRPDLWQAWDRGASLSIGFIRTPPHITLFELRSVLIAQLKGENLPDQYAYLRHVGRGSTVCSSRQERTLMARDFAPPFYPNPELCILSADDSMAFQPRYIPDNINSLNNSQNCALPSIITNSPRTPIQRPIQMHQHAILPQVTPSNVRLLQTSAPMQHPSCDRAKSPSFRSLQNCEQLLNNSNELMMAEINFLEAKKYLADAHARSLRSQYLQHNSVIIDESNPGSDDDSEKDDEKSCFIMQLTKNEEERERMLREEEERKRKEEEDERHRREEELSRQEEAEQKERDDIREAEEKLRKQMLLKEEMRREEEKNKYLADLKRKADEKKKEAERQAEEENRLEEERQAEQERLEKEALEKAEEEEKARIREEEEAKSLAEEEERRIAEEEERRIAEEEERRIAEAKRKADEEEKQKMIAEQEMQEFAKYEEFFHNDPDNTDDEEADEAMKLIDNLTLTPRPWAAIKDAHKRVPKEYTPEEKEEVAYLKAKIMTYRTHRKAMESKHHDLLIRLTEMESTWDEDETPEFESKWRPKCKEEEERTPQLYERNRQLRLELQMLYKQADTIISKAQAKKSHNTRQGMAFPSLKISPRSFIANTTMVSNNLRINLQKLQADVTDLRKRSATAHIKVEAEKSNREAVEKEVKQLRQELINSKISSSVAKR